MKHRLFADDSPQRHKRNLCQRRFRRSSGSSAYRSAMTREQQQPGRGAGRSAGRWRKPCRDLVAGALMGVVKACLSRPRAFFPTQQPAKGLTATMTTATYGEVKYATSMDLKTSADGWAVEGLVSTFNNTDLGGDIVLPGAFRASLRSGSPVRFLYQHDTHQVLGAPIDLRETDAGLFGKFRISKTQLGTDVRTLLLDQAIGAFSIGYLVDDQEMRSDGVRLLKQLTLLEASIVTLPMNEAAVVTGVKQQPYGHDLKAELRLKMFRRGGATPTVMPVTEAEWRAHRIAMGRRRARTLHGIYF